MFSLYNVDIYKQKKVVWTRINGMFFEAYRILSYGKFVRHSWTYKLYENKTNDTDLFVEMDYL